MIVSPSSRRLRVFGGVTIVTLIATYIHVRSQWNEVSFGYARNYYKSVTSYFGGPVYNNTLYFEGNEEMVNQYYNSSSPCKNFPDTDGILLIMKTGATETFDKMPVHLLTTMTCLPDFLIFSDMEQQVGPYHIHDALAEFDESAKAHNADFDLYRDQKECPVSQKSCVDAKRDGQKAWNLDKYKFLPMMEQTWRMRPGRDWYIFAEADTYIFWANIVHWLKNQSGLNPREKLYLGSRSFIGGTPFAHGGSGYILSGTLLRHLIEYHPGVVKQYNVKGAHECCGDLMLAQALEEYEKVKIQQVWPMINGEKPSTLPYGPGHWCEPIFTMHHMNAEEISNVWQFEQTRKTDRVLLIRDLYDGLIRPKMQVSRENWDNLSDDVCYLNPDPDAQQRADGHLRDRQKKGEEMNDIEKEAWKSWENCAKVCESQDIPDEGRVIRGITTREEELSTTNDTEVAEDSSPSDAAAREAWERAMNEKKRNRTCFQYRWHDEVCCTAKSFKLGAPKMPPDNGDSRAKWVSGWHLKGINDWIDAIGECKKPAWKTPEP
ncbi:glycosyltransferase family 31 protein [Daldinia caldariorum]|uniref:glycosyltransferase family 31 protein n=1 Tax=Daldinia caldariorum TaxID=326644 RepID=UPI0020084BF1|nr:glycosyltransferase family 31 protein [Daldinia caldariorum]KAI1466100.1 glycosyltransferase family 31 protein [Daldinia caldariorum]